MLSNPVLPSRQSRHSSNVREALSRDSSSDRRDVSAEDAITLETGHDLAHSLVRYANPSPRLERSPEINGLRSAHELDRQNVFQIVKNAPRLPRRAHRHGNDIFLASVGRN